MAVVAETLRIADLSAAVGVDLVFEYHGGTLTDSNASAAAFAKAVQHPAVFFGWQPRTGASVAENLEAVRGMLPRLATLHVFNWSKGPDGGSVRHPLCEAGEEWGLYLQEIVRTGRDHVALLEFVRDNSVANFEEDASTLRELVSAVEEGARSSYGEALPRVSAQEEPKS